MSLAVIREMAFCGLHEMSLYFLIENMIRGLDGDETVFLDMVAKQQEDIANRRFDEESQEIKEYRVWLVFSCVCLKLAYLCIPDTLQIIRGTTS